jgi:hypothetical protein
MPEDDIMKWSFGIVGRRYRTVVLLGILCSTICESRTCGPLVVEHAASLFKAWILCATLLRVGLRYSAIHT